MKNNVRRKVVHLNPSRCQKHNLSKDGRIIPIYKQNKTRMPMNI